MSKQGNNYSGSGVGSDQKSCSWSRILFIFAFLAVATVAMWYFLGQPQTFGEAIADFGNFTDVLPNITGDGGVLNGKFWNNDPYLSDNSTQSWLLPSQNKHIGLSLTILNALDDTWQEEFQAAVQDWENGDPDALTLTTQRVAVDHSCSQVSGVMKVCNGNYGETGWLGINEILSDSKTGQIQSSVAKMNEYYLLNADYYERQYTMCHEIGHGFGLPHTDENFDNRDLGNCLDYTKHPQDNLHPGVVNFNRLASLYGVVPSSSSSSAAVAASRNGGTRGRQMKKQEQQGILRNTRQDYLRGKTTTTITTTAATNGTVTPTPPPKIDVPNGYEEAIQEFMMLPKQAFGRRNQYENKISNDDDSTNNDSSFFSWRMLQHQHQRESTGLQTFVRKLSDNYVLTIHILKPLE